MGKITDPVSQEAKRRQDDLYEALGSRVQSWRTHLPTDKSKAQCDIEDELGLPKGRIGKIESASSATPSLYELAQLSKAMGITCDELITGISPQHMEVCDKTGLSEKAVQWLERQNKQYPDYTKLLNNIFEDEKIAETLLDSILLYASCELLQIKVAEIENHFPLYLDGEKREAISRTLAMFYLQSALELIRKDWNTTVMAPRLEQAADKQLEQVRQSLLERFQRLDQSKQALDTEIYERELRENGADE